MDQEANDNQSLGTSSSRHETLGKGSGNDYRTLIDQLCRLHSKEVYLTIYAVLRNREDAVDLTQEVFLRAFEWCQENGDRLEHDNLQAWLKSIGRNLSLMALRRRAVERKALEPGLRIDWLVPRPPVRVSTPEDIDKSTAVANCLKRLSEQKRLVVVLSDVEGCTDREIAGRLGASRVVVRKRLSRARKELRICIHAEMEG